MSKLAMKREENHVATDRGSISILNPELYEELVESIPKSESSIQQQFYHQQSLEEARGDLKKESLIPHRNENEQLMRRRREKERDEYFAKIQRESQRRRVAHQNLKDEQFVQLYNSLIEDRLHVLHNLSHTLFMEAEHDERKKQEAYEEWLEKVFNPIQNQIDEKIRCTSIETIEKRRRKLFEEFLQMSNKKPLFRDIILPQDHYNPLEHNEKYTIRYSCNSVTNRKGKDEDLVSITSGANHSSVDRLDVRMWDKMDATPYGHYEQAQRPSSISKKKFQSKVEFDHYDRPKSDVPKPGKRVNYPSERKNFAQLSGME